MPYLSATELSLRLPANVSIGTNTSPLTLGEVGSIIAEVGAHFDSVVARAGYSVPVDSGASAYPYVQQIIRDGAGARVLRILFWGNQGSAPMTTAEEWEQAYKDALAAITDGDIVLIGVGENASDDFVLLPRSYGADTTIEALERGASAYVPRTWEP